MPQNLQSKISNNYQHLEQGLKLYNNAYISHYNSPRELIQEAGSTKLFHFGGNGIPLVFIPSHINKSYILDISPAHSLILNLKKLGINPYLIDWGELATQERNFNFEDYFNYSLKPLLETVKVKEGRKIILAGHCMGGLFALAGAQLLPRLVGGLVTISTPWNFHSHEFLTYPFSPYYAALLSYLCQEAPFISKHLIKFIFYLLRYKEVNDKYIGVAKGNYLLDKFIMFENWANDGVDMSTPLFIECMQKLIIENQPYLNRWQINGEIIKPETIKQRSFCAIAIKDKITPSQATLPLGLTFNRGTLKAVDTGHLGMIVSEKNSIGSSLAEWIKTNF